MNVSAVQLVVKEQNDRRHAYAYNEERPTQVTILQVIKLNICDLFVIISYEEDLGSNAQF
jgi:hypothetical protein